MHSSNSTPIVCDVGSGSIKIGYANSRAPAQIIPSVVGHIANGNYKFGKEAILNRDKTPCSFPIQGTIKWDEMELLLSHAIDEVTEANVYSRNSILVTEPSLNPIKNKKRMAEILFETMDFDRINISNQAILVLYAQGLLSGIVIDCGESVSQVVPVFEGFVPNHLVKRFSITGRHITKYLSSLLQLRSNSKSVSDMVTVQDIKEKLCYAAHDLEQDRRLARDTTVLVENYVLPDGTTVKVGREKFECTEALFDPSLIDMECAGLSDFVFDTIQECDISTRKQFYEHIVLSGGSSMFPGMPNRLQKDIEDRYINEILQGDESRLKKCKINIEAPSHRQHTVYLGGCILAELMGSDTKDFWMTRQDFEEDGLDRLRGAGNKT